MKKTFHFMHWDRAVKSCYVTFKIYDQRLGRRAKSVSRDSWLQGASSYQHTDRSLFLLTSSYLTILYPHHLSSACLSTGLYRVVRALQRQRASGRKDILCTNCVGIKTVLQQLWAVVTTIIIIMTLTVQWWDLGPVVQDHVQPGWLIGKKWK